MRLRALRPQKSAVTAAQEPVTDARKVAPFGMTVEFLSFQLTDLRIHIGKGYVACGR